MREAGGGRRESAAGVGRVNAVSLQDPGGGAVEKVLSNAGGTGADLSAGLTGGGSSGGHFRLIASLLATLALVLVLALRTVLHLPALVPDEMVLSVACGTVSPWTILAARHGRRFASARPC